MKYLHKIVSEKKTIIKQVFFEFRSPHKKTKHKTKTQYDAQRAH